METVKTENESSSVSSPDLLYSAKSDEEGRESVIESMPSENGVLIEEKAVQTNRTTLAKTKRNHKLNAGKGVLQKKQSTLKTKKRKRTKKESIRSLAMNITLATIFSRIPLATLIEMGHKRTRRVQK